MAAPLRVLIVEDVPTDAELMSVYAANDGTPLEWLRVDTEADYRAALGTPPDVILSDCRLPNFSAVGALEVLHEMAVDVPLVLVSGTIGEETAADLIRHGAADYVSKDNLSRLGVVVARAIAEARLRCDRAKAVEDLRRAEALYRGLFENSVDGIFQAGADGRILMANATYLRMFECRSIEQLLSISPTFDHRLVPPDRAELARLVARDGGVRGFECRCQLATGATIWLNMNVRAVRANGAITYYEGSVQDATARKLTEAALVRSEARFTALFESKVIGILIADPTGLITEANDYFLAMLDHTQRDLPIEWFGASAPEFSARDREALSELKLTGRATPWEKEFLGKDGRRIPVLVGGARLPDGALICFTVDLTQIKTVQANLVQAKAELEGALTSLKQTQEAVIARERLHALGQMASGIAHDFNNNLSPIVGLSELILNQPQLFDDRDKLVGFVRTIHQAGRDAALVVSRLRDFYRTEDGVDRREVVDLKQVAEQAVELTRPRWADEAMAASTKYRIVTDLREAPVSANGAELREMLVNLIFNALDAMPRGGELRVTVDRAEAGSGAARLVVADSGVGMTPEVRKRCFEPFFTTKGAGGTGLGLATSYGIVKRHNGEIHIESEPGRGTRITVTLPTASTIPVSTPPKADRHTPHLHVLVIDDHEMVRDLIDEYLRIDGHAVDLADGPLAGLALLSAGRYDLIITDRSMPEMSGEEVAREARRLNPGVPILMLTGFGEFMNAAGERPEGIDAVVSKPVSIEGLRDAVELVIERRHPASSRPTEPAPASVPGAGASSKR